ncbi:hypothetical protein EMPS_05109 [Entomortierella parvispora]|uniref:Phytanoyl-CoA dioxygenase n=1 Tax=Entomortierella parvispora TaxID=205924 RepID=A0A9P3H9V4_9FUNG|nr:hypothetical protein EMPS_05109 [Entomortierella parvispora]
MDQLRQQFHRDGYIILQNVLPLDEVQVLQREADCLVNFLFSEGVDIMRDHGGIIEPTKCGYIDPPLSQLTFTSHRSFCALRNMVTEAPDTVIPILFGRLSVLAANFLPLSDPNYPLRLFNEQYIVKSPKSEEESKFDWHQDSQYMDSWSQNEFPIISCWTALDDVNQSNGTLLIEPFPRPLDSLTGTPLDLPEGLGRPGALLRYQQSMASAYTPAYTIDMESSIRNAAKAPTFSVPSSSPSTTGPSTLGGFSNTINLNDPESWTSESRPPVLVEIPMGSTVFLSGFVRHCSLGNKSSRFRRAYMPQFSAGEVMKSTGQYVSMAVSCNEHAH